MRRCARGRNPLWHAGLLGLFGSGGLIACGGATESNEREDAIEEIVSRGGTRAQGQCIVDGVVERWGGFQAELPDDPGGASEMMRLTLECMSGGLGEVSDCLVESVAPQLAADELSSDAFVEAVGSADPREMAEAAMQCRGMTPEVARCVADTMAAELGDDVFERGIDSSTERRHALEANLQCEGMTAAAARCVSEAVGEEYGEEAFGVTGLVSPSEQRFVFEATLACGGMTAGAARCATDAMAAEFGDKMFGFELELSSSEQAAVEAIVSRCVASN
jgi:hypothetical protein